MGKVKISQLRSATLVETIVAMVIILVIFGIVTSFLIQVSSNSFSTQAVRAIQLLNVYAHDTEMTKAFFNNEVESDGFIVEREVKEYGSLSNLLEVTFRAYDERRKLLFEKRKLFLLN